MPIWAQVIVGAAATVTALGVLWRTAVRPVARAISRTEEFGPVLYDIAREFQKDGGSTLRDRIEATEREARAAKNEAVEAKEAAVACKEMLAVHMSEAHG